MDYRYIKTATRTVLSQVDGPLANGPLSSPIDSDITRLEWSPTLDRVTAIVQPGGRRIEIDADDQGRWSRVLFIEGRSRVQIDARYSAEFNSANVQSAMTRTGWLVDESGATLAGTRRLSELRVARDAGGGLTGLQVDAASWGGDLVREVRAALDVQRHHAPNADTEPSELTGLRIAFAASARPSAWSERDDREPVLSADWGPAGSAAETTVLSLKTPRAQALRLVDDAGQVVAIRNPGQLWQTARRDAAGRIVELRDPRGARASVEWDAANRLRRLTRFRPATDVVEQTMSRRYEAGTLQGELIEDTFGTRWTGTHRDALGRILSETTRIQPRSELATALSPVETTIEYQYDAKGRLQSRTLLGGQGGKLRIDQSLDADGRLVGTSTRGWLPRWLGGGRQVVTHVDWQRLAALDWATTIEHGDSTSDVYAPLESSDAQSEEPDPPRLAQVKASTSAAWPAPGNDTDASGLPATLETSQGLQRLRWNAASQLVETVRRDGSTSRYVYDARGRRVVKLVRDARGRMTATVAVYEDSRLLAEADANGRLTHAYSWIGERPVAQLLMARSGWWAALSARLFGAPVLALHTDRAGQVLSMTDAGREVWKQRRFAKDGAPASEAAPHQPLRFVGQYHDDESGLDYHGARFYEPGVARFISPDPAGVSDAVNDVDHEHLLDLYAYAAGRPDDFYDPTGAARIHYHAITTGASGAAIGTTQGFTKARWAFVVDDVQAPSASSGNATLDQLQQKYATQGTGVLYDAGGDYLQASAPTAIWQGTNPGALSAFTAHYGDSLISIPQFSEQMGDAQAARLIASYIAADYQRLQGAGSCPLRRSCCRTSSSPPKRCRSG